MSINRILNPGYFKTETIKNYYKEEKMHHQVFFFFFNLSETSNI